MGMAGRRMVRHFFLLSSFLNMLTFKLWLRDQGAYSQNSNVSHYLSATLTVSPSKHLILDSQSLILQYGMLEKLVTYIARTY